jgi:outer membrane receptor protein involved in Fe transport
MTFYYAMPGRDDLDIYEYRTTREFYDNFDGDDPDQVDAILEQIVQPENFLYTSSYSIPAVVDPNLKQSNTWQFSAGFQKQFFKDFAFSIDYLYKRDRNAYSMDHENFDQHTFESYEWTDPWLGNTITLWQQVDRIPDTGLTFSNAETAKKRHHMIIVQIKKRPTHNWSMMFSYVWQDSRTNYAGMASSDLFGFPLYNFDKDPYYQQNPLAWGREWCRPHQFKLQASWYAPLGFIVGVDFRAMTENADQVDISSYYMPAALRMYRSYGSPAVLLEQRGSRVGRMYKNLDMRIAKYFKIGGSHLEVRFDIFNVFNDNYSYFMNWFYLIQNPEAPKKSGGLLPPRNLRLGITWRF